MAKKNSSNLLSNSNGGLPTLVEISDVKNFWRENLARLSIASRNFIVISDVKISQDFPLHLEIL